MNNQYNAGPQPGYGYQQSYNRGPVPMPRPLDENRGLVKLILLSLVTCGIYSYYFIYKLAADMNVACYGDGEETAGLVKYILLSIITCGIYAWVWHYKVGQRIQNNGARYGLYIKENGGTILLWMFFGSLLCGIGPFVALHMICKNLNDICRSYNRQNGF